MSVRSPFENLKGVRLCHVESFFSTDNYEVYVFISSFTLKF